MKLVLVFLCAAVAAAQYVPGSDVSAEILRNEFEQAIDNSYRTAVETSNGIAMSSQGESLPGPQPESGTMRVSGSYSYTAPDGTPVTVNWVADENGYRATSNVIPQ